MNKSILITGANRGIGFEFLQHYAKEGWEVFAVVRNTEQEHFKNLVSQFENITPIQLDVADFSNYTILENIFKNRSLDVLLNNAGTSGEKNQTIGNINAENFQNVLTINTIAPIMLTQTLYSALQKGQEKLIVNITSRMGSIADNTSGRSYAYRTSKAALNCLMHSLQIDIENEGFKVLLLHPGWVKTDMGGDNAAIDCKTSIEAMCQLIAKAHTLPEQFYHYEGKTLPW